MPSPMEIYALLPQTNCKRCGESSCMAFAFRLQRGESAPDECPPLVEEEQYGDNISRLGEMLKGVEGATETGLIIHEELCTGCGNCVIACPVNVANDPKGVATGRGPTNDRVILEVVDEKVKARNIKECRRFGPNRILCNACIEPCPYRAIEFVG